MILISLGIALGTNRIHVSFINKNNALGMLESLGFAGTCREDKWVCAQYTVYTASAASILPYITPTLPN